MSDLIFLYIAVFLESLAIIVVGSVLTNIDIKRYIKQFFLICLLGAILYVFLSISIPELTIVKWIVLLFLISMIKILSKLRISIAILIVAIGYFIIVLAELLSFTVMNQIVNVSELIGTSYLKKLLLISPHTCFTFILAIIFYVKNISLVSIKTLSINSEYNKKVDKQLSILSVVTIVFSIIITIISYQSFITGKELHIVTIILLITIYLLITLKNRLTNFINNIQKELDYQYEELISSYFNLIKSQHHDFVHHLNTIYGLLKANKVENCKEYIAEINKDVNSINEVIPLYNVATSSLLLTLKSKASLKGIELNVIVHNDFKNVPLRITELNRIVGNLIENAIDAVEENSIESKWINVIFKYKDNHYTIIVSNTGTIEPEIVSELFKENYSTKDSTIHQGVGLFSVKNIVENYNGFVFLETDENQTDFITNIPSGKSK